MQAARPRRTRLVQRRVAEPLDASLEFSKSSEQEIPLVLVPDDRWVCSCFMQVPSGIHCIQHTFGKDYDPERLAEPGLRCTPAWNRIAYCVTPQACTFNAPVKSCPTKDNVMVDCDLTLVFAIGPDPKSVKTFVYQLGAARFDDFLGAAVEESIRLLIRTCEHTEIYELRSGNDPRVVRALKELNKKFGPFGIRFSTLAITDCRLSPELQQCLQDTTNFKSKILEQDKKQKHELDKIQFEADKLMETLVKKHERTIQDLRASRTRAEIERQKDITDIRSKCEVEKTNVSKETKSNEIRASSQLTVAENQEKSNAEDIISKAKAEDERGRIKVDQEVLAAIYEAEQEMNAAKDLSQAIIAEAEAEAAAAESLRMKREHDLNMAKLEVLQVIAKTSKMVISGDNGDRLIESMLAPEILSKIQLTSK